MISCETVKHVTYFEDYIIPGSRKNLNLVFPKSCVMKKKKTPKPNLPDSVIINEEDKNKLTGYPLYPANEDIYNVAKKEDTIDPDDMSKRKSLNEKDPDDLNEKDFNDDVSGGDLDVPGADLDDQQKSVGSEDEENDYYSLGGDDHNDLEEDKGE